MASTGMTSTCMTSTGISAQGYARRRRQLMRMAGDDAIVVIPSAPERIRSRDTHYPYRQDSDLWYLTGFAEPEAVLVLIPGRKHGETLLFCRERDPEREGWDGPRRGPEGAVDAFGMDDAYPIDDLDEILPGLLEGRTRVYYHFGRDTDFDLKLIGWLNRVRAQMRMGAQPPHEFLELGHLLDEMRLFKDRDELKLMQRAADISIEAHRAAMRAAKPGIYEYELQAEIEHVFRRHDAEPAYGSIIGAGDNACVLHYVENDKVCQDGDMVLMDVAAEYAGWASDLTRTVPVNGRFTKRQRDVYDAVLRVFRGANGILRPGNTPMEYQKQVIELMERELVHLGLFTAKEARAQGPDKALVKKYFMHGTSHHLGLDVHDVCPPHEPFAEGMVFTIEPGIYLREESLGVRLENDVLLGKNGNLDLMGRIPIEAEEIEALMAARARP